MWTRLQGRGGIVMIDAQGRMGHFASTPYMPWAAIDEKGQVSSGIENREIASRFRVGKAEH